MVTTTATRLVTKPDSSEALLLQRARIEVTKGPDKGKVLLLDRPDGDWVRLFRRDPAYVRTDLLRDCDATTRFVTVDYWSTREACRDFRQQFDAGFREIDTRCAKYTVREKHLGDFDL